MMELSTLRNEIFQRGIIVKLDGGRLCLYPSSAITEVLLNIIKDNKPEIVRYLTELSPVTGLPLYLNPPECHNPFTPHATHELPWECNPYSCYCFKEFGYPRLCQGAPCRWIWPDGFPKKD
jgi:hypothetical protein